jgi:hypothetical protein
LSIKDSVATARTPPGRINFVNVVSRCATNMNSSLIRQNSTSHKDVYKTAPRRPSLAELQFAMDRVFDHDREKSNVHSVKKLISLFFSRSQLLCDRYQECSNLVDSSQLSPEAQQILNSAAHAATDLMEYRHALVHGWMVSFRVYAFLYSQPNLA